MYIETGQVSKWRQRKRKKNIVSVFTRFVVLAPVAIIVSAGLALAGPTGGVITGGSGGIETSGSATNITQTSPRLDINWNTFSTGVGESINFTQPTAAALALNRVIGGVPSELRGALNANGRVVILNDSGITFFGSSRVNVGALLATTAANVSETGTAMSFSGANYGAVLNHGSIHVSDGGFAVLAAPYVANTGLIQANLGTIELASTNGFTVDFRGDGLIGFTVTRSTLDGMTEAGKALGVDNSGTLTAGSGSIGLTASAASSIVESVVNLDGVVDASSFGVGSDGGTVLVTSVGDINIGGVARADGGADGNGGSFMSWADRANVFEPGAVITARGGEASGDGGFIEVSGSKVTVRGIADASAGNGAAGTFLLDPNFTITIANGAGTDSTAGAWDATIYEENIENTSVGGTNVVLESESTIVMKNLADGVLQGGSGAITMTAGLGPNPIFSGHISFDNKENKIATTSGAITMTANDGAEGGPATIDIGHLETLFSGADITLTAGLGGIKTGNLCAGGTVAGCGAPRTNNPGDITLSTNGSIKTGDVTIYAEDTDSASAYLKMDAGGSLAVGNISLTAIDPAWSHDNATVKADLTAMGPVEMGRAVLTANGEKLVTAALNVTSTNGGITLMPVTSPQLSVSATAREGGSDSAVADADIKLTAATDIVINGIIKVKADATNTVDTSATANADLNVYTQEGGNIEIGSVLVESYATLSPGGLDDATALSNALLDPGNNLTINGGVNVLAKAENKNSEAVGGAVAESLLDASGNDIKFTGNTLVDAVAISNASGYGYCSGECVYEPSVFANADAWLNAYNDLTVLGGLKVNADADDLSGHGDGAAAFATLSGIAANGSLAVTGDINVTSDSTIMPATGDIPVYTARSEAASGALLTAGVDANITGDTFVEANAEHKGYLSGYVNGGANGVPRVTANGNGGILRGQGNAFASSGLLALAGVDGNALLDVLDGIINGTIDPATVDIAALFSDGDLNITGDIKVTATADSAYLYADAEAAAVMGAGTDATILTDPITVLADARTGTGIGYGVPDATPVSDAGLYQLVDGIPLGPGAEASSFLGCRAGMAYGGEGGGDLYITGDLSSTALATGVSMYTPYHGDAFTGLFAAGDITVEGADPIAYAPSAPGAAHARVQGKVSGYDETYGASLPTNGAPYTAELVIESGGAVSIEPKKTDNRHEVISSLESRKIKLIEPLGPGRDPLTIGFNGLVSWATGAGVTSPSRGFMVTPDLEGAIARGVDPTTVLPSPAAGGIGLSSGLDAYSVGGPDYCDQVVSGYCLLTDEKKKNE